MHVPLHVYIMLLFGFNNICLQINKYQACIITKLYFRFHSAFASTSIRPGQLCACYIATLGHVAICNVVSFRAAMMCLRTHYSSSTSDISYIFWSRLKLHTIQRHSHVSHEINR